ncbi:endonuclease III domain-containing protein [Candidatus Woesearchaeota archaeon]|nr:endonuclease III domain-containing protein [Candidatus Woesearchaeota archaeon]
MQARSAPSSLPSSRYSRSSLYSIYTVLLKEYGMQGWWPLLAHQGMNPTKTGSITGYHPGDYSFPKNEQQRFEICIGAILTQNTSWVQVEKALKALNQLNALTIEGMAKLSLQRLKIAIKPAGYFNQKAKKIREFVVFFTYLDGRTPSREELLSVWGVGPETADSILLYAYHVPSFVVDAYTRRILSHLRLIEETASYNDIKAMMEQALPQEVVVYQEYHALLVEHAKQQYSKKPYSQDILLSRIHR